MIIPDVTISAFTTLIVVMDPIGLVPIFLSLTTRMTSSQRRRTGLWAASLAALVLIFFVAVGDVLLGYLGISLAAFRIAGGLMLFYTAFEMVFGSRRAREGASTESSNANDDVRTIAAFPLAIPLMAGPGAITACILLASQARGDFGQQMTLVGIIVAVCLLSLVCFLGANAIDRLIGKTGKSLMTRLLGVLLAALAVQFVADGWVAMVPPLDPGVR